MDEDQQDALRAWVRSGEHTQTLDGLPDTTVFKDVHRGEWDDFKEFADHWLSNTGYLDGIPREVIRHIDTEALVKELTHDYLVLDKPDSHHIYAFSN